MPDPYERIRSLPFPALAGVLGMDLKRFKTRKDGEYYGPCPIHGPKTNTTSFSYAADGRFHCFSCNAKGRGALDLVKAVKNVGFKAAVELLEPFKAYEPPKEKSPVLGDSGTFSMVSGDSTNLKPLAKDTWRKFGVPCPWLEDRIADAAVREKYGVFCYNNPARKSTYSGRVMIPVRSMESVLYGYLGRRTSTNHHEGEPKYLFPKGLEKSRFLFGAWELSQGLYLPSVRQSEPHSGDLPLKIVYLVESPFCVMKFAMMGLPAVSPFGWSVSKVQISLLCTICKGLIFLPDRNKNTEAAAQCADIARNLWVRFPPLPAGIDDPEQLTLEQIQALTSH